jgi:hypothetical protein
MVVKTLIKNRKLKPLEQDLLAYYEKNPSSTSWPPHLTSGEAPAEHVLLRNIAERALLIIDREARFNAWYVTCSQGFPHGR